MITVSPYLLEALSRSDCEPLYVVSFASPTTSVTLVETTSYCPLFAYTSAAHGSVESVAFNCSPIDLVERAIQFTEAVVRYLPASLAAEHLLSGPMLGGIVSIYLAEQSAPSTVKIFSGIVSGVQPLEGGGVELTVGSSLGPLFDAEIYGSWANKSPYTVLTDIMDRAGVPSSRISDDYNLAGNVLYWLRHYVVSRHATPRYDQINTDVPATTEKAADLFNSLASVLPGVPFVDSNGSIRYLDLHDNHPPTVADWTDDDIADLEFEQLEDGAVNRVICSFGETKADDGWSDVDINNNLAFAISDSDAVSFFGGRESTKKVESEWLGAVAYASSSVIIKTLVDAADAPKNYQAQGQHIHAFCGTRGIEEYDPYGPLPTDGRLLSVDRPAYWYWCGSGLYIRKRPFDQKDNDASYRIYRLDQNGHMVPFYGFPSTLYIASAVLDPDVSTNQLGAVPLSDVRDNIMCDATIAVANAQYLMRLCAYGLPIVSLTTGLQHVGIELCDCVSITSRQIPPYAAITKGGTAPTPKWMIIQKKIELESCCIRWTLARL